MYKIKKTFLILILLALSIIFFSGCSKKKPEELSPVTIADSGYIFTQNLNGTCDIRYALELENLNKKYVGFNYLLHIQVKDTNGAIIDDKTYTLPMIYPESKMGFTNTSKVNCTPVSVEFNLEAGKGSFIKESELQLKNPLSIANTNISVGGSTATFSGEIVNSNQATPNAVTAVVIFKNENGKVVSGAKERIENITAKGNTGFSFNMNPQDCTNNYVVYAGVEFSDLPSN